MSRWILIASLVCLGGCPRCSGEDSNPWELNSETNGDSADAAPSDADSAHDTSPADASRPDMADANPPDTSAPDAAPGDVAVDTNPSPTCSTESTSTLSGVEIQIQADECAWTLDELEAGVTFEWSVVVDAEAPQMVMPAPGDAGGCGRPGASGLITSYTISNEQGDRYCLCDQGLCAPYNETSTLVQGTHPDSFEWTGHNWGGPSDTGLPMGPLFEPGPAVVRVTAGGETLGGMAYEVTAELPIEVLP